MIRQIFGTALLLVQPLILMAQITGDPGYGQQIYWAPSDAPNQGLAIAIQREILFGAYYGYEGGQPSFVTLIGTRTGGADSHDFTGDVFQTTSNGNSTDVGNFTWDGNFFCGNAQPCGNLTMSSPVFSTNGTFFIRFSFNEGPDVGHVAGGVWWTGQDICSSLPCLGFAHAIEIGGTQDNPSPSDVFDGDKVAVVRRLNNGNNGDAVGFVATTPVDPTNRIEISTSDPFRLLIIVYPLLDGGTQNGGSDIMMVCYGGNNQQFCNGWSLEDNEVPTQATANFGTINAVSNQSNLDAAKSDDQSRSYQGKIDQVQLERIRHKARSSRLNRKLLLSDQSLMKIYQESSAIRRALGNSQMEKD